MFSETNLHINGDLKLVAYTTFVITKIMFVTLQINLENCIPLILDLFLNLRAK